MTELRMLHLDSLHRSLNAKMVTFAGYSMPLSYPGGVVQEHLHTRQAASMFDISHMGTLSITGRDSQSFLSYLLPIPCDKLIIGKARYTVMLNENGGIIDDLVLTRTGTERFLLVINAACREKDIKHMHACAEAYAQEGSTIDLAITPLEDRSLLALQGPAANDVLNDVLNDSSFSRGAVHALEGLTFMTGSEILYKDNPIWITRCGYTGEDGFELLVPDSVADMFALNLLQDGRVNPGGLGARDSLRLEAGLPLYGNDMDEETNVYEADIGFVISKLRLENKKGERDFIGAEATRRAARQTPQRMRVGIKPGGKAPIRSGVLLYADEETALRSGREEEQTQQEKQERKADTLRETESIGWVSSGGFSPTLKGPVAFAYVEHSYVREGTILWTLVRGRVLEVTVHSLPFVPHNYKR